MANIQTRPVLRLLSSRPATTSDLARQLKTAHQIPRVSLIPSIRQYHQSYSLQDKSVPSPSQPQQSHTRKSFLSRRREQREARNRLSTLALEHPGSIFGAQEQNSAQRNEQGEQEGSGEHSGEARTSSRLMSQRSKRIILLSVILLMPVIGRDIMEIVVPGLLGTVIYVGSKVKAVVKWVRQIGSGEGL